MTDKATATSSTHSFVDDQTDTPIDPDPNSQELSEAKVHDTVGQAMRLIAIGVDVILGLLVGLLTHIRADPDFAAWRELVRISERVMGMNRQIGERTASFEIAKKLCMTGILRAENELNRRHPPYHALALAVIFCLSVHFSSAQKIERYEGILIDTSASIGRGRANSELFREYLRSTKMLLLTEPPNSEVRVSVIATDSFGGVRELLLGWTPESRGVFTADLNRARHQMASAFVVRSAALSPGASGTDIFGALWHLKALFDSGNKTDPPQNLPKSIWIFSDMVNETPSFPMPELLSEGAEQMLEQAKAKGLIVPLPGYQVHVEGASPNGLTPQQWFILRRFWTMYFAAAGAELVSYSVECNSLR